MTKMGFKLLLLVMGMLTHHHLLHAQKPVLEPTFTIETTANTSNHYPIHTYYAEDSSASSVISTLEAELAELPENTIVDVVAWEDSEQVSGIELVGANTEAATHLDTGTYPSQSITTSFYEVTSALESQLDNVHLAYAEAPTLNTTEDHGFGSRKKRLWLTTTAAVVSGITHYFVFVYKGASPELTLMTATLVASIDGTLQHATPWFAKMINKPARWGSGLVNRLLSTLKTQTKRSMITIPLLALVYVMKYFTGVEPWDATLEQAIGVAKDIGWDTALFIGSTSFAIEALKAHDPGGDRALSPKASSLYQWSFLSITLLGRFAQFCEALNLDIGTIVYGGMATVGVGALAKQTITQSKLWDSVKKFGSRVKRTCASLFTTQGPAATASPLGEVSVPRPETP